MLSYQHIYHAGNPVDCQKHLLLGALMTTLQETNPALCYIDTHAGRGMYDLESREATKIMEFQNGIDKIWPLKNWPKEARKFQKFLEELNPDGTCRYYPGSPMVANAHARMDDHLELFEIHPQEVEALYDIMGRMKNVEIHNVSGWDVLMRHLQPHEDHGIVLIDPSYEVKEEYLLMCERVKNGIAQWPTGTFLIWYPMLQAGRHNEMIHMFAKSGIKNILKTEIILGDPETIKGLYGTGMLMINLPPEFETTVAKISKWLQQAIGQSTTTEFLENTES